MQNPQSHIAGLIARFHRSNSALVLFGLLQLAAFAPICAADTATELALFEQSVKPILEDNCFDCHAGGMREGSVAFDDFTSEQLLENPQLWHRALKMIRAGMMPPAEMEPLSSENRSTLDDWIVTHAFHSDREHPQPGHVTLRRLNRQEYRKTIRDLLGVDYDTRANFPADDSGHGFDNIGQVLTISPLLLEKYLAAAREIVDQTVPKNGGQPLVKRIPGQQFHTNPEEFDPKQRGPRFLSFRESASIAHRFEVKQSGTYRFDLDLRTEEKWVDDKFDYNRCQLKFLVDGQVQVDREFSRMHGRKLKFSGEFPWKEGEHELRFELEPLTPDEADVRSLKVQINSVSIEGPLEPDHWVKPARYDRFFPRPVPDTEAGRREYARELLGDFASRAYRRPPDQAMLDQLVDLAVATSSQPGQTFESSIAEAMIAVLASPRFLFREEVAAGPSDEYGAAPLDDWTLASRLSYFLWSTMPDEELRSQAAAGTLRDNLQPQLKRMLESDRSKEFVRNFVGQWLRSRDVDTALINGPEVMRRDEAPDLRASEHFQRFREYLRRDRDSLTEEEREEFRELRELIRKNSRKYEGFDLSGELRRAMRQETEMLFERILKEDRSLTELLDSNYTYLNETLAKHYGIPEVSGGEMRLVELPADSPRGGVLTQGTMLVVTSNPDRTSPVKRGLYVLENLLGTPPPPPPPNIPSLEDAGTGAQKRTLTVAESLEIHRSDPLCSSCHNRMDPLGLALENFNALGRWRETDRGQEITAHGQLITGEEFTDVETLKKILMEDHRLEFYRCLTEKMLIYALGRGLDYHDVVTVDAIVDRLESSGGKPSELLRGIVTSAPFLQTSRPERTEAENATARIGLNATQSVRLRFSLNLAAEE